MASSNGLRYPALSPGLALRPQAFFLDSQFGSFLIYGAKLRTELPFSAAVTFLLGLQVSIGNQRP